MMNLITDPWIPVVYGNGEAILVGLDQLIREAETIRDLNASPQQRIALMRLLLCITQAALDGPRDEDDWKNCRPRIIPASLDYLDSRKERFELHGDRPFLQAKTLQATNNEPVEKLDASLSSELFNHTVTRDLSNADIALNLLTTQCFSLGGTIGVTLWDGYTTNNFTKAVAAKGPGPSSDGPCAPSSMLHSVLRGSCMLDSIFLNLLTKSEIPYDWGLPIWDAATSSPVELQNEFTGTYLGRLVPLSRGILLDPGSRKCTYVAGLKYESLPNYREPMGTVLLNRENEVFYMGIRLGQHVWRELGSILSLNAKSDAQGALALKKAGQAGMKDFDLWVGGVSRKPGQNLIYDMLEWNFLLPVALLGASSLKKYADGVAMAARCEVALKEAIQKNKNSYAKLLKTDGGSFVRKAIVFFWSTLDSAYQVLVDIAASGELNLNAWRDLLRRTLRDAFEQACPHETARQIQVFAQARRLLAVKELEPDE